MIKVKYISERELILLRDKMSIEELRAITNKTKEVNGYVNFRAIFKTMGYEHSFNDMYYNLK